PAALGLAAEQLMLELLDLQLEMGDQRLIIRPLRPDSCCLGLGFCNFDPRSRQRRLEGFHVIWHGRNAGLHDHDGIIAIAWREAKNAAIAEENVPYPARVGRQLCCGLRQSMPSSK